MISKLIHRLPVLIATATDRELAQALQYLKVENRLLRERLPKSIRVTPTERRELLKFGTPLGTAINDIITIVTPRTFRRWLTVEKQVEANSKETGRPGTETEIRQLIIKLGRETAVMAGSRESCDGWGLSRHRFRPTAL